MGVFCKPCSTQRASCRHKPTKFGGSLLLCPGPWGREPGALAPQERPRRTKGVLGKSLWGGHTRPGLAPGKCRSCCPRAPGAILNPRRALPHHLLMMSIVLYSSLTRGWNTRPAVLHLIASASRTTPRCTRVPGIPSAPKPINPGNPGPR